MTTTRCGPSRRPRLAPLVAAALVLAPATAQPAGVYRFDMGTDGSPAAPRHVAVTANTQYDAARGFGWIGDDAERTGFHRTAISENVVWNHEPDASLVDGVASPNDLVFRVDLPNGRYAVEVFLGDLGGRVPAGMGRFLDTGVRGEASGGPGGPLYSMAVSSGGRLIVRDVEARTYPHRGSAACSPLLDELGLTVAAENMQVRLGNAARVAFDQTVDDEKCVLRFHGDDSTYRAAVARLKEMPADERMLAIHAAGGPFTRNSVLAVRVRPYVAPAFALEGDQLRVVGPTSPALARFAAAFNARDFVAAAAAVEALSAGTFRDQHARIMAMFWLAGHPDYLDERELVPRIAEQLDAELAAAAGEPEHAVEEAEWASLRARLRDLERGLMNFDQRTRDGQEMVTCMNRAEGYFQRAQAGEPLYWKSQLYRARIWYGMDPNRRSELWPKAESFVRALAEVFPENRWVRYYLEGDASGWPLVDYRAGDAAANAPRWAVETHRYYNRMLDLCEWWIEHRQQADNGALGGEWGDDVELLPMIAYTGLICPDASPMLLDGTRRFADGLWNRGRIIDAHNGFFHLTTDAEHSAEFTGDLLGMLMHVDRGQPVALERALKTAKLMRDLWTGRNANGQRLFRSSYLGAFHVPAGPDEVDSAICGRAIIPALGVLEYNGNPEIARMVIEYADTLLGLADSTAKGKPRGVLPGPVVYATGELGHAGSSEWWLAPPGLFQDMFSFPRYHGFRHRILTTAWNLTGDRKYLAPISAEAKLAERYGPPNDIAATAIQMGSVAWVGAELARMGVIDTWRAIEAELNTADARATGTSLDPDEVADEAARLAELARNRWPMMTDDAIMTDRVAFPGCIDSTVWYAGAKVSAQQIEPAVTYAGPGRDFAALVLRHNPRFLRLVYYGFHADERDVTLRFWELEPGATYELLVASEELGASSDLRDSSDARTGDAATTRTFTLRDPSGSITLALAGGRTYMIEVAQTSRGRRERFVADPAVGTGDVRHDPRGHLLVNVHNLGSRPADDVSVDFYDGDPEAGGTHLGRTIVSHLEPPNALVPQVVRTGIEWRPTRDAHEIHVVLDRSDRIEEISEANNRATAVIAGE